MGQSVLNRLQEPTIGTRFSSHCREPLLGLRSCRTKLHAPVVYVRADYGDDAAIAPYEKRGVSAAVVNFDIWLDPGGLQSKRH